MGHIVETRTTDTLELQATGLAERLADTIFNGAAFSKTQALFPKIPEKIDRSALREYMTTEVAKAIREKIAAGTEDSLLGAIQIIKNLRDLLDENLGVQAKQLDRGHERVIVTLGKNYIGPITYMKAFKVSDIGLVPLLPSERLLGLMEQPCPIERGTRTIGETHRLVFVPTMLGGKALTLNHLIALSKNSYSQFGGPLAITGRYHRPVEDAAGFQASLSPVGRWLLFPMCVHKQLFWQKDDADQLRDLRSLSDQSYRTATSLELATAIAMSQAQNRDIMLPEGFGFLGRPYELRCADEHQYDRAIGCFRWKIKMQRPGTEYSCSLNVTSNNSKEPRLGRAIVIDLNEQP
jgi:hypothetical protein